MLVYIYIPTDAYTAIHYAAQELVTQCMSMHFIIITSCARPQGGSQGGFAATRHTAASPRAAATHGRGHKIAGTYHD